MSIFLEVYYYFLSFLRTKERKRISILEKKPGVVWIIVCDERPAHGAVDSPATYSHHWTSDGWEANDGDDYHVYTSMTMAQSYLDDEMRGCLVCCRGCGRVK